MELLRTRCWPTLAGALGLVAWLSLAPACAETFVFREQGRGPVEGRVLAEFEDVLLLALDDGSTRFISRADLARVVGPDGQEHDDPAPGAFLPVQSPTPAGAATDLVGEAWVVPAGGVAQAIEAGPAVVPTGGAVRTGEAGLLRVALLGDAVLKLGVSSEARLIGPSRVELTAGEGLAETGSRPLELTALGLQARLAPDARLEARQDPTSTTLHLSLDRGDLELLGADLRLHLPAGQGLELTRTGPEGWRVTADSVNTVALELHLARGVEVIAPGHAHSFGARPAVQGDVWRLLRAHGELLVSRGETPPAPLAPADIERLSVGPGDGLETGPTAASSATLVRVDGATLALHSASRLEVGPALRLVRGRATVEASSAAVELSTPAGPARLSMCVLQATSLEPDELRVLASGGEPALPLGPDAEVTLEPAASGRLRRTPEGHFVFELEEGRARVSSRQGPAGFDPHFAMPLAPGQSAELEPGPQGPTLLLPGGRALRFETAGVDAEVRLREPLPEVAFRSGAVARLREGLWLGLARVQEQPQLRFKAGPRLGLGAPLTLDVHNPTVVFGEPATTLELQGELEVRLQEGGGFAAASLALRQGDRLELPRGELARLVRHPDTFRLALADQRRLWIESQAPPVQARFGDAAGTLFLTMPGAPALGLPAARPVTVLATEKGEFVVLHGETADAPLDGLEPLLGVRPDLPEAISRDRMRDLLDVPPVDSPSGP